MLVVSKHREIGGQSRLFGALLCGGAAFPCRASPISPTKVVSRESTTLMGYPPNRGKSTTSPSFSFSSGRNALTQERKPAKLLRFQADEYPSDGVMRRNSVGRLQELAKPAFFDLANYSMFSQLSALQITAQTAMMRISMSLCGFFRSIRGPLRSPNGR